MFKVVNVTPDSLLDVPSSDLIPVNTSIDLGSPKCGMEFADLSREFMLGICPLSLLSGCSWPRIFWSRSDLFVAATLGSRMGAPRGERIPMVSTQPMSTPAAAKGTFTNLAGFTPPLNSRVRRRRGQDTDPIFIMYALNKASMIFCSPNPPTTLRRKTREESGTCCGGLASQRMRRRFPSSLTLSFLLSQLVPILPAPSPFLLWHNPRQTERVCAPSTSPVSPTPH
jgi:hypothetical protein